MKIMDTIGIIALSGCPDRTKVLNAKMYFELQGFKVKLSENIFDKSAYLAGADDKKIKELHKFFLDPEIGVIMAARGGYGAIRLINHIDYGIIKNNPKIFCGFSDVTALLLMIYKNTGLVTYHGPMACPDFGELNPSDKFEKNEKMLFTQSNYIKAVNGGRLEFEGNKTYRTGKAEGIIWGGNLATVISLCGLDFIPNEDFIFFAEDINEPVYKIDRMFQQLVNIKEFVKYCRGIVLGDFPGIDNEYILDEYLTDFAKRVQIPVAGGFRITHNTGKITVPIGRHCILNNAALVIP